MLKRARPRKSVGIMMPGRPCPEVGDGRMSVVEPAEGDEATSPETVQQISFGS